MSASNDFDDFDDFAPSESSGANIGGYSGHVPDRAGHSGRRVRARVADFIGGGDSYAGPKEAKPEAEPKAPLRDRIAAKIATKPKAEEAPAGGGSASSLGTVPHEHDHWCDDFCTKTHDPAPAPAPAAEDKSKRTSPPSDFDDEF